MSGPRYRGADHAEIHRWMTIGKAGYGSADAEAAWDSAEKRLREIDTVLAAAVRDLHAGWEGAGAEATRGGLTPVGAWATAAAAAAAGVSRALVDQASQAAWLRVAVPEPPAQPVSEEPPISLNDPGIDPYIQEDWAAAAGQQREAAQRAVDLMVTYEKDSLGALAQFEFADAPPVVTVQASAPSSHGGGGPAGGGGAGGSGLGHAGDLAVAPAGTGLASAVPAPGGAGPGGGGSPSAVPAGAAPMAAGLPSPGSLPGGRPPGGSPGGMPPGGSLPGGSVPPAGLPSMSPAGAVPPGAGRIPVPPAAVGPRQYPPPWGSPSGDRSTGGGWRGDGTAVPPSEAWRAQAPAGANGERSGSGGKGWGATPAVPRAEPGEVHRPGPAGAATDASGRQAAGRTPGGHPGMMPMSGGGGAGGQGDTRHRPAYLVDDSNAFVVDLPYTDPVIN